MPRKKNSDLIMVQTRLTKEEHARVAEAAKADRRSIAQFVAKVLLEAVDGSAERHAGYELPPPPINRVD